MPLFEVDAERPVLVQPTATGGGFGTAAQRVVDGNLDGLLGEQIFPVAQGQSPDEPHLLALDAAGLPVVIDVVGELSEETLTRALNHAGAAGQLSRSELAARYLRGPQAFHQDVAAFYDNVPLTRAQGTRATGARLIVICQDAADGVLDALDFLRQPGSPVAVLRLGVVKTADGRRFVDVSPLAVSREHRPVARATAQLADSVDFVEGVAVGRALTGKVPVVSRRRPGAERTTAEAAAAAQSPVAAPGVAPAGPRPAVPAPSTTPTPVVPVPPAPAAGAGSVPVPPPGSPVPPPPVVGSAIGAPHPPSDTTAPRRPLPTRSSLRREQGVGLGGPDGAAPAADISQDGEYARADEARPVPTPVPEPTSFGDTALDDHGGGVPVIDADRTGPQEADAPAPVDIADPLPMPDVPPAGSGNAPFAPPIWSVDPLSAPAPDFAAVADPLTAPAVPLDDADPLAPFVPPLHAADLLAAPGPGPSAAERTPTTAGEEEWGGEPVVRPDLSGDDLGAEDDPDLIALAQMIGTPASLVWARPRRGQRYEATLEPDGYIVLVDGSRFRHPDLAAIAVSGTQSADGWSVWRFGDDGPTLTDAFRARHH